MPRPPRCFGPVLIFNIYLISLSCASASKIPLWNMKIKVSKKRTQRYSQTLAKTALNWHPHTSKYLRVYIYMHTYIIFSSSFSFFAPVNDLIYFLSHSHSSLHIHTPYFFSPSNLRCMCVGSSRGTLVVDHLNASIVVLGYYARGVAIWSPTMPSVWSTWLLLHLIEYLLN